MYYRDRRHKTQDYRDWELAVLNAINVSNVQQKLQQIREAFDEKRHSFLVKLTFMYPRSTLLNKQGTISSRAEDLTNVEKPLVDILFLPKYHVQPFPSGAKNINADDKHILRLVSSKQISPNEKFFIKVQIALIPIVGQQ